MLSKYISHWQKYVNCASREYNLRISNYIDPDIEDVIAIANFDVSIANCKTFILRMSKLLEHGLHLVDSL